MLRHLAVATALTALSIIWSLPLVLHVSTHLPGAGLGDNTVFLWNFWWMRTALASGQDFFHTTYLFAPVGGDLTLHTHTALPAFLGATVLGGVPLVAALNLMTLAALSLNAVCAYLLAWRLTGDRGAAVLGGIIFGSSPYFSAHLNGHFNLTTAWPLPLFALVVVDALRGSSKWAFLSGVLLGITAYVDYYYVVYEIAVALCVLALIALEWSLTFRATKAYPAWCAALLGIAMVVDLLAIVAIDLTGGTIIQLGPIPLSMQGTFNLRQLFWIFAAFALWIHFRPHVAARRRDGWSSARTSQAVVVVFVTFLVVAAPLVWHGLGLLIHGQYVTQTYYWRSAPVGVDVGTLFLGNPFQGLWGPFVRRLYAGLGIDVIEWGAWLGIVPVVLSAFVLHRKSRDPNVRQWAIIGAVFFVWALGPHLHAFGQNTGMILPETFVRYVPIVSNARIPGRAMVMVYLATAMLSALAAAEYRLRSSRPLLFVSVAAALAFADSIPAPFPLAPAACPSIYLTLRDRPERGAVAELPLGLRDGFGELTPVDHTMLVCQTIHQRPLVGGVLARLPANVLPAYRADPLLAAWLQLSHAPAEVVSNRPLPTPDVAARRLTEDGIAFVVLNRKAGSRELRDYVEHLPTLNLLTQDEERSVYVVDSRVGPREQSFDSPHREGELRYRGRTPLPK